MAYVNVGEIRKGDDNSFYFKVLEGFTAETGSSLSLRDPKAKYDAFVKAGKMTEDEAEEKKGNVPEYIKFEVVQKT